MHALPIINQAFTTELIAIARTAGKAIIDIYNSPAALDIATKSDDSPLTAADLAAHHIILDELSALLPVPMISEESLLPDFDVRRQWPLYWLIDPLDGTKEFIARTGEFTVNIALVINNQPLVGVVHVPVGDITYLGVDGTIATEGATRAEKYIGQEKIADIRTRSLRRRYTARLPLELLVSHRHGTAEVDQLLTRLKQRWPADLQPVSAGSSLKFCLIAEGKADFYPRLAPTCEWDTAAAQAVLVAAGGAVVNVHTRLPLTCNKGNSLLNPSFFAWGDTHFDWHMLLPA